MGERGVGGRFDFVISRDCVTERGLRIGWAWGYWEMANQWSRGFVWAWVRGRRYRPRLVGLNCQAHAEYTVLGKSREWVVWG
jgi:hypothetical protein